MKKISTMFFAVLSILLITGCNHSVPAEKILYSRSRISSSGTVNLVEKYDRQGNVIYLRRGSLIEHTYRYDSQNRMIYDLYVIPRRGITISETEYKYYAAGYQETVITSTETTVTEYDAGGVMLSEEVTYSDGKKIVRKYLKNGCLSIIENSSLPDFSESCLVEEIEYPSDGSTELIRTSYSIDENGNYIVTTVSELDTVVFVYTRDVLLLSYSVTKDSETTERKYEYDENMNRIKCFWETGNTVEIEYDSSHRLIHSKTSDNYECSFAYDTNGNRIYTKYGDEEHFYEYDTKLNLIYEKRLINGEKDLEYFYEYNEDNLLVHAKYDPYYSTGIKEQFFEYNDMKDNTYHKDIYVDDEVVETSYTYEYEWY